MIHRKLPKKWKPYDARGYGVCTIHDKWEKTMLLIYEEEFYSLCEWAYFDLFGEEL